MYNQNERSNKEHRSGDAATGLRVCGDESSRAISSCNHEAGAGGAVHGAAVGRGVSRQSSNGIPYTRPDLPHCSAAQHRWRVAAARCMPTRVGRPCRAPGCPAIVTDGAWCPAHKPADAPRPAPSLRGYDKRWQKIRRAYLARFPLCVQCEREGRVTAATEVDHIRPLALGGTNDTHNLQPLCKSCHSKKTRKAMRK